MASWDPVRVKAHIRLTAQKLANIQERHEAVALGTQAEVASLLAQNEVAEARKRAEQLYLEDVRIDVLGKIEMYCDMLLGFFAEVKDMPPNPKSPIFEPACCILYAGHSIPLRELTTLHDILVHRFGPAFLREVMENQSAWIPNSLQQRLKLRSVPHDDLELFLSQIAQSHSIHWVTPLPLSRRIEALVDLIDPASSERIVDISRLRRLCSKGIPSQPPWLRPRVWRLLLDFVPVQKDAWPVEMERRRRAYYDLMCGLFSDLSSSLPTNPLSYHDQMLTDLFKSLSGIPDSLTTGLPSDSPSYSHSSLSVDAQDDSRIHNAKVLEQRLARLRSLSQGPIASESLSETFTSPAISLSPPENLPSNHFSALLRLIYLHNVTNPRSSPYSTAMALVIYNCLCRESEGIELVHAEADTYWMLGALIGEITDLSDDRRVQQYMGILQERLKQVDSALSMALHERGLDPSSPHYSYRWLTPMLCYTFPIDSLLVVWDGILAQPHRTADVNPKIDFLVEICTSMLICAKPQISSIGARIPGAPGLWDQDWLDKQLLSPRPNQKEFNPDIDFLEGNSLLQNYPLEDLGGPIKILATALDLPPRPSDETASNGYLKTLVQYVPTIILPASPSIEDSTDDGEETETTSTKGNVRRSSLGTRMRASVLRGISNQSAMDPPPSPSPPPSPMLSPRPSAHQYPLGIDEQGEKQQAGGHSKSTSLWDYTRGLRNSDTAATLSKIGANWKAKVISSWTAEQRSDDRNSPFTHKATQSADAAKGSISTVRSVTSGRHGGFPSDSDIFSERPAVFRNPRDSFSPHVRRPNFVFNSDHLPPSPEDGGDSDTQNTGNVSSALRSLNGLAPRNTQKKPTGPKPLLLDPANLMTPGNSPLITRSATSTPVPHQGQWSDVYRESTQRRLRDSVSSTSTLSTSNDFLTCNNGSEKGRVVPLRRITALNSPALRGRMTRYPAASRHNRYNSTSTGSPKESSGSEYLSDVVLERTRSGDALRRGWGRVPLSDFGDNSFSSPTTSKMETALVSRDDHASTRHTPDNDEIDAVGVGLNITPRPPRMRSKRHSSRPARLPLQKSGFLPLQSPGLAPPGAIDSSELSEATTPTGPAFAKENGPSTIATTNVRPRQNVNLAEDGDDEDSYDDILGGYGSDHAPSTSSD